MKRVLWIAAAAVLLTGMTTTPAMAAPGPPDHPEWWFDTWNVPGLWAGGARGEGITIGEIDTGINASLPELSGNILAGTDFGDFGGNGQTDRDDDEFGHGTAMASLMVAHDGEDNILGIAPDAQVLPIAVPITGTTDDAGGDAGDLLLKAIRWAADHGAKIITMSLGAARGPDDTGRSCPADEQATIDYALSKGDIVVASGGNSGDMGSPVEEPSVCLGVVSVGAVDESNTVPVWSSRHPYLTVSAPGVGVPSIGRIPGQAFFGDGTSQAAALTAGGLAVIWSKYPKLTGRQVVARLLATLDFKRTTRDPASGYGVINIGSAVTATVPADAPNPVFDAVAPFLAQDKAVAVEAPDPKVKQATTNKGFPGNYAVTPAPNPLTSGPGLGGIVGGSIGLLAMALLITGATRRRRLAVPGWGAGSPAPGPDPITEPISVGAVLAALGQVSALPTPGSPPAAPPLIPEAAQSENGPTETAKEAPEVPSMSPAEAADKPEPHPASELGESSVPATESAVGEADSSAPSHESPEGASTEVMEADSPEGSRMSSAGTVDTSGSPASGLGESSVPAAASAVSGVDSSAPSHESSEEGSAGVAETDSSVGSRVSSAGAVDTPAAQPASELGESSAPAADSAVGGADSSAPSHESPEGSAGVAETDSPER